MACGPTHVVRYDNVESYKKFGNWVGEYGHGGGVGDGICGGGSGGEAEYGVEAGCGGWEAGAGEDEGLAGCEGDL